MHYMSASPADLRSAYREERARLAHLGDFAQSVSSPGGRRTIARQTGSVLRRFDLICNVARKRGIDLLAK